MESRSIFEILLNLFWERLVEHRVVSRITEFAIGLTMVVMEKSPEFLLRFWKWSGGGAEGLGIF